MTDLGIIFLHHSVGATTANNLALLRRLNPEAEIVTVSQRGEVFPGGYNTADMFDGPWRAYRMKANEFGWRTLIPGERARLARRFIWRNAELAIYQWYTHKRETARRWIVAEWDTLCLEPAASFFREVWDADVAGAAVHTLAGDPTWPHFRAKRLACLPAQYREQACGISPLPGLLFSDDALGRISRFVCDDYRFRAVFCELRVGTAAVACGYRPQEMPARVRKMLSAVHEYRISEINPSDGGWWHKVKDHDPLMSLECVSKGGCVSPSMNSGRGVLSQPHAIIAADVCPRRVQPSQL